MSGWCLDCGSERCVYDDASILPTAAGDTLEDEATSVSVAVSNVAAWVFGLLCGVVLGVWGMGELRGWRR